MTAFTADEAACCRKLTELALTEDLGLTGDRTSEALIPPDQEAQASFVARRHGVIAGLPTAQMVCQAVQSTLRFHPLIPDGSPVTPGTVIATISGSLRGILAAERTALNFLQHLSGIATLTAQYVAAVHGTRAKVLDTRKTLPGYRLLAKYAVRQGGGYNHRIGLYDGILIKDNHIAGLSRSAHPIIEAVERARSHPGNAGLAVEIEVDSLEQFEEALQIAPEIVLLDNMPPNMLRQAVALRDSRAPQVLLEASGGVNLDTIAAIAATGVDRISVGALTHSAPSLDIGLDYGA